MQPMQNVISTLSEILQVRIPLRHFDVAFSSQHFLFSHFHRPRRTVHSRSTICSIKTRMCRKRVLKTDPFLQSFLDKATLRLK